MNRNSFALTLYMCIVLLLSANLFFVFSKMVFHRDYIASHLFYFDTRLNIPFFFSLLLSAFNLVLLWFIARQSSTDRSRLIFWSTMFGAFLLFTVDEAFYLHQHFKMSTFGRIASYDRSSMSHYIWVIPYFLVFGTLITIIYRYRSTLSTTWRKKLLVAASVFLFGAVIMEFVGTYYGVINPEIDLALLLIKSLEGTLQMIGAVLFMQVFLEVIADYKQSRV